MDEVGTRDAPAAAPSDDDAPLGGHAPFDEAFRADGEPRAAYVAVLEALARAGGPARAAAAATARAAAAGLAVNGRPLPVDPLPRILTRAEWEPLAAGIAQRARALDALVADVFGPRRAVAAGAYPEALLATSPYWDAALAGLPQEPVGIIGFDVVRLPGGRFAVLEDNLLTPGHAAVPAARELLRLWEDVIPGPAGVHGPARALLGALLGDPARAVVLADDPAAFEPRWLGAALGVRVVAPGDLRAAGDRLVLRDGGRRVAVVWQRTGEDRLHGDDGRRTVLGELLLAPLRAGTVRVVNRLGCGVADDKAAGRHLAAAARVLLGEELTLDAVPVHAVRPARPARGLVVKQRFSAGGHAVAFGAVPAQAAGEPEMWIAQPDVPLSVHPTVAGDALVARPVDLRVFAVRAGDGYAVLPGGVSRFAPAGSRITNTSAGGGVKDVWIVDGA